MRRFQPQERPPTGPHPRPNPARPGGPSWPPALTGGQGWVRASSPSSVGAAEAG